MTATTIFPLALWLEGTNQNSTPANDNALRIQAAFAPAIGFAAAAPATPAAFDLYVVSTPWGGFAAGNIVINLSGTWKEFSAFNGMYKVIGGVEYVRTGGAWNPSSSGGGGSGANPPGYNAQTGTSYTLALADAPSASASQGIVSMSNAAANVVTVPPQASVAWVTATMIQVIQIGAGKTTIAPGSGVVILNASSLGARVQNSTLLLTYLGGDTWVLSGDVA